MNVSSELGISPVLLQAISQTLTTNEIDTKFVDKNISMDQKSLPSRKAVSHILDGMNEPVASLLQGGGQIIHDSGDEIKHMLDRSKKDNSDVSDNDTKNVYVGGQPVSMVNVLTALASQHLKHKGEQESEEVHSSMDVEKIEPDEQGSGQQQIIIYYNNENGSVPSPGNNIVVGELDGGDSDQLSRIIVQQEEPQTFSTEIVEPTERQAKLIAEHERQMLLERQQMIDRHASLLTGESTAITNMTSNTVNTVRHSDLGASSSMSGDSGTVMDPSSIEHLGTPCPICGDKISGYHYGIFTCESCKGFFKRTVQNKKSFVCHRHGECEINIFNRKKCPACRFAKCVGVGMKLEAIRVDRTRGGRSSYDGCSPHGRVKTISSDKKNKRTTPTRPLPSTFNPEMSSRRHLVAILNHSTPTSQQSDSGVVPVPELLTDIMNLEPLLSDEDIPLDMIPDGVEESDDSLYTYLMQLTELRLYKLVRWARNLPQFGAISTDDQILLLQNCWSDLLALGVCWRSIATPGVIALSAGKTLTLKKSEELGFDDVVGRMIALSEHLRQLEVDQFEYVALKVLLLISPDVKGLKDPNKIMEHQEKLMDALLTYTTSHSFNLHNKFGEMLLRLPELSRISFIGKEQLLNRLPANMTSCGLLVELLKGENAAKDIC